MPLLCYYRLLLPFILLFFLCTVSLSLAHFISYIGNKNELYRHFCSLLLQLRCGLHHQCIGKYACKHIIHFSSCGVDPTSHTTHPIYCEATDRLYITKREIVYTKCYSLNVPLIFLFLLFIFVCCSRLVVVLFNICRLAYEICCVYACQMAHICTLFFLCMPSASTPAFNPPENIQRKKKKNDYNRKKERKKESHLKKEKNWLQ